MSAESVNMNNGVERISPVTVSNNWIGGKQLYLHEDNGHNLSNDKYRIKIKANEGGVFNIEAITSDTISVLEDKDLKFQSLKNDQRLCYSYDVKDQNEDITLDIRAIKGGVNFYINPGQLPTKDTHAFNFQTARDRKFNLSSELRAKHNQKGGMWYICATTDDSYAFFAIQVYLIKNASEVQDYKKLLLSNIFIESRSY